MYGWYKLMNETHNEMKIGYSVEKNKTCDGILNYNKNTDEFTTEKLSEGADDWSTKWLSRHILSRIIMGKLSETPKMIAIG